jgi:hypothetical protein
MSPAVTVDYERRAHRFDLACTCGWTGRTTNLSVVAQPIAEHLRVCDGEPRKRRKPYDADSYERTCVRDAEATHRPGTSPTANDRRTKLDPGKVREIRRLCATGERQSEVARRYGISIPAVSAIVHRRTWRNLD